jgi:hypothetical protein
VKDVGGVPNPDGEAEVDWFAENFAAEWNGVTKKLLELNPGTSRDSIGRAIPRDLYLFAPARVNSAEHELMLLFDMESDEISIRSYAFMYDQRELVDFFMEVGE